MTPDAPSLEFFASPWWLDLVARGRWGVVRSERGGRSGVWPYVVRRRGPFRYMTMPPMTQYLGPAITDSRAKYPKAIGQEHELIAGMFEALPSCDLYNLKLPPTMGNWLGLYWEGFRQTTRYTYILPPGEEDQLWSGLQDNIRRDIRKARGSLAVRDDLGAEDLLKIIASGFARLGRPSPYSDQLIRDVLVTVRKRGAGRCLFAVDDVGRIHAVLLYVWDNSRAYYVLGGQDSDLRTSGANSYLFWSAVTDAANRGLSFDFEGSMIRPVERFVRGFGGHLTPYMHVYKMSRRFALASGLRQAGRAARNRPSSSFLDQW